VRTVQFFINRLGYTPPLKTDGQYGDLTRKAVRSLRGGKGEEVGPETVVDLHELMALKRGAGVAPGDTVKKLEVKEMLYTAVEAFQDSIADA
jgi:hypothetical protein